MLVIRHLGLFLDKMLAEQGEGGTVSHKAYVHQRELTVQKAGKKNAIRAITYFRAWDVDLNALHIWVETPDAVGAMHKSRCTTLDALALMDAANTEDRIAAVYSPLVSELWDFLDVLDAMEV